MSTLSWVWRWRVAWLALACMGAGCAQTGTTVVSRTEKTRYPSAQRLLVVSQVAWADAAWAGAFEKALLAELHTVSIQVRVQSRNPLALQADKSQYAAEIRDFQPDVVLVVEPSDGTVDARGRSLMRRFEAGLFRHYTERAKRDLAWRATIEVQPAGSYITATDMPALARDLVARLTADGTLPKQKRGVRASPVTTGGRAF